jgi:hypothetical protein
MLIFPTTSQPSVTFDGLLYLEAEYLACFGYGDAIAICIVLDHTA